MEPRDEMTSEVILGEAEKRGMLELWIGINSWNLNGNLTFESTKTGSLEWEDWHYESSKISLEWENWYTNQPEQNENLKCAIANCSKEGKWIAKNCAQDFRFICEKIGK